MPFGLRFGSCCLQGRRHNNEDAVGVADYCDLLCFMVADGMGGWEVGALASRRAISTISSELAKPARDSAGGLDIDSALWHAFARAHTLRQGGLKPDHAAVKKGADWLKANQRVSGRWFTQSLNTDRTHYITHAGTAFALMALASCE